MKSWLKVLFAGSLFASYMYAMVFLNYHSGPFKEQKAVAGVSAVKSYAVNNYDPLVQAINSKRMGYELKEDARLDAIATARLADMLSKRYYAHVSPDGMDFADLLVEVGLQSTTPSCENLLMSLQTDSSLVVDEWMSSPPHRGCMLNPDMNAVGKAGAVFERQTGQMLYVTIYASIQ